MTKMIDSLTDHEKTIIARQMVVGMIPALLIRVGEDDETLNSYWCPDIGAVPPVPTTNWDGDSWRKWIDSKANPSGNWNQTNELGERLYWNERLVTQLDPHDFANGFVHGDHCSVWNEERDGWEHTWCYGWPIDEDTHMCRDLDDIYPRFTKRVPSDRLMWTDKEISNARA